MVCQRSCGLGVWSRCRQDGFRPKLVARRSLLARADIPRVRVKGLLRAVGGSGTCAHFRRLTLYPRTSRGGPRQARRSLLRGGGHRAGAAALVEDHGDLPGLVALLRHQFAEFLAGETSMGKG